MTTPANHQTDGATERSEGTDLPATEEATRVAPEQGGSGDETAAASSEGQQSTATSTEGQGPVSSDEQLVSGEAAMDFKTRWEAIQQGFVDDPRSAVSDADSLVTDVLQQLSNGFDEQHRHLESQWSDGEPDTEQLRSALQRYRAFFDRLLTI